MNFNSIKVLIADNQFLTRVGIRSLVLSQTDCKLVGEATSRQSLKELISLHKPDVLVIDPTSKGGFDYKDLDLVRANSPKTNFLIVSNESDNQKIFNILEKGVNAFVTKQCSPEEITNAILATARRERFFCNKILDIILDRKLEKEENCEAARLTLREVEIVQLISQGLSTREIADKLCISTHTIYTHRKNILKKLNFTSVTEMVLYAVNQGIIPSASHSST